MLARLLTAKPIKADGFNHRGREVSRLEAFSDAVFGFAITLLVVSLEVPTSFADLMDKMSGFLSFAICFALLVHFWFKHYHFFRRYGMQDVMIVIINAALLFVLLLYIYPLKFLFSILAVQITHLGPASAFASAKSVTSQDVRSLFTIYGIGFAVVYLLYAALYLHAYRSREQLKLSRLEVFDTVSTIAHNVGVASIGLVSLILAQVLPLSLLSWAGWIYGGIGPVASIVGVMSGRRRGRIPIFPNT